MKKHLALPSILRRAAAAGMRAGRRRAAAPAVVVLVVIALSSASFAAAGAARNLLRRGGTFVSAPSALQPLLAAAARLAPQPQSNSLNVARKGHTATRLPDGRVLVVGGEGAGGPVNSSEIFDPATRTFTLGASAGTARTEHAALRLNDGRILVTGGRDQSGVLGSTEIYDPSGGTFAAGPSMSRARAGHSATLLADNRVLVAGGDEEGTAEVIDARATATTLLDEPLYTARMHHSALLLKDGTILVVGGNGPFGNKVQGAEIFDPVEESFSAIPGAMKVPRSCPTLRELPNGFVQVIGGDDEGTIEVYVPATDDFQAYAHLPGSTPPADALSARTRPALFRAGQTDALLNRASHTLTEIPQSNLALVAGGSNNVGQILNTVAVVDSSAATITTDRIDYAPGQVVTITGTGFQPGETVALVLHEEQAVHADRTFTAATDAAGNFTNTDFTPEAHHFGVHFVLTAKGQSSGFVAQTAFTDAGSIDVRVTIGNTRRAYGQTAPPLRVTLCTPITDGSGDCTPINGKTVEFAVNGEVVGSDVTGLKEVPGEGLSEGIAVVTYDVLKNAGAYTIVASFVGDDDYQADQGTSTLTVGKALTTITWVTPAAITYGTALGTTQLNATIKDTTSSSRFTDQPVAGSFSYVLTTGTIPATGYVPNAGSNALRATFTPTDGVNYAPSFRNNSVSVSKALLTVTPNNFIRLYGQPNPVLTGTVVGLVNNDPITPLFATAAAEATGVGNHDITFTLDDPALKLKNYTQPSPLKKGTLAINKAPLNLKADDKSRPFGVDNPPLTFAYSGFVLGENASVLGGAPTLSTTANASSAGGTYPITLSVAGMTAANYDLLPAGAALTVTKAQSVLNLSGLSQTYDGTPKPVTVTTDPPGLSGVSVSYAADNGSGSTAPTNAGSYTVTATTNNPNYQSEPVTGTLVIHKAMQVINFTAIPDKKFSGGRMNVASSQNGGVATASSTTPDAEYPGLTFPVSSVNNGDRRGLNWEHGGGWRDGTDAFPDWVQVDFASPTAVDEINVFSLQDAYASPSEPTEAMTFTQYGVTAFDAQYWDGARWVTVPGGSVTNNGSVWRGLTFPAVTTTKVRVLVHNALAGRSRLVELEAWGVPAAAKVNHAAAANGGVATASSTTPDAEYPGLTFPVSSVNNGDRRGLNWEHGGGWRDGTDTFPDWVQVDFNGSKTVDEIDVFTVQDAYANAIEPTEQTTFTQYGVTAFDAQYWDGAAWVNVPGGSVTGNDKVWRRLTFTPVRTTKVRVLINNALASRSRVVEVEAWGGPPVSSFALAATSSANLPVAFEVVSGNATLRGNMLTLTGTGSVTVRATQAGDANRNAAAPVTRTFSVAKADATINILPASLSQTYSGMPRAAAVTTTPPGLSGLVVSYSEQDGTPVSAPTDAGTYQVTASLDNPNYAAAPVSATLVIPRTTVQVNLADATHVFDGKTHPVNATVTGGDGQNVGTLTYSYTPQGNVGPDSVEPAIPNPPQGSPAPVPPAPKYTVLHDPPATPHNITVFPERDFVSAENYSASDGQVTINVLRRDATGALVTVGSATATPGDDPATPRFDGIFEVNHPGGSCWVGRTPNIRPGDIVRVTNAAGVADQTTVAHVFAGRPVQVNANTVRVSGRAMDAGGNPLPIGDIEQRLISSSADPFVLSGRRDLRAPGNGILVYDDEEDPTRWTATYTNLTPADVARALRVESRILWLGRAQAAGNELTIFEAGDDVSGGPQAPCSAPLEGTSPVMSFPVPPAPAYTTLNDPPTTLRNITVFPERDFVSIENFAAADGPVTINVLRRVTVNGTTTLRTVGSSTVELEDDPTTSEFDGLAEVNHPGGGCWVGSTPDIQPGDIVRVTTRGGVAHQTTVANVIARRAQQLNANTVVVQGTAQDAAGNPLPIADIEQRMISSSADRFNVNGRRDIRAVSGGGEAGTLAYDAPGSIHWTATYTNLGSQDVARALRSETRILWLGRAQAAGNELTIFEAGDDVSGGPQAPCNAPREGSDLPVWVGVYDVSVSLTGNPNFTVAANKAQINITKATPVVNVEGGSFNHDGQPHPAAVTVTGVGGAKFVPATANTRVTYYYYNEGGVTPGTTDPPVRAGVHRVAAEFTGSKNYAPASGPAGGGDITINAVNAAPQVNAGPDATINEGSTFSGTASFTDVDSTDRWTVTVDYGDGTGAQPVTPTQSKTIPLSHVYKDNATNPYTVTVTVTDAAGTSSTDTARVTVVNVSPQVGLENTPSTFPAGYRIKFNGGAGDPSPADVAAGLKFLWTATKNGGAYVEPNGDRQDDNDYMITPEEEGTYVVTLRVTDKDGGAATVSRTVVATKIEPSDDFNDNWMNVARWYLMRTPMMVTEPPQGQLHVETESYTTGYDGYYARTGIDMTNQRATVEAVQPAFGDGLDTDFVLEDKTNSAQNRLTFKVGGAPGYLRMEERSFNGSVYTSTSSQIPYDVAQHRFWRFRHDAAADTVKWETSPDCIQWTVRHTAPRKFSLTNIQAQLFAGRSAITTTTTASTVAIFDNYRVGDFPPPSTPLSDNFDDNLLNTALWRVLDPLWSSKVREQNQRLELVSNGVESSWSYNFWNKTLQVEIPQAGDAASFTLQLDGTNYYLMEISRGRLWFEDRADGIWNWSYVTYSPSAHRFQRFRHNAAANTMSLEVSPDGQTWRTLSSVPVLFSLNSMKVVMTGNGGGSSTASTTIFDNLRMEANQ